MAVASEGDVDGALQWTSVMCPHLLPPERLWKGSLPESDPLRLVHIQLQQMLHLSKHHDFHVSFEAFQMATVAGLAMAMLDRVQSPSLLLVELSSHVEPFLEISSNTSLSDVLVEYVEEKAGEIPFDEQRCRILLDKIEPLEKRAKATLVILRSIHLPYSHSMLELAVTAARWPSSCQMELQEQFRLMQLEELFRKYGLKYDIRDPRLPARLCRYLCTQVDNADAFDDALTLAQASHQMKRERVVVHFMQNVLMANFTHERCNQLTKALESVDAPIKWSVAIEVVQFGVMFLESYTHLSQLLLAFVTSLASFSCNHRGYWRVINVTFQHALRQISHLQSAYQLPVSLESFCNKSCHEVLLKPILQPWLDALRQPTHSLKRKRSAVTPTMPREMTAEGAASLVRAQQCSSLLGMSNNNFRAFLGKQAAAVGDIDQTLRFTRNTDASTLKHVALALLQYMVMSKQTNSRGFGVARDILVLCVTHESCTTLSEDVVLLKQASLLSTMLELTTDQAEARDEHYQLHLPWRIYDLWYRGVALTLHPSIMPLAINYVMNQYNLADQEQILMSCKELVSHLVDVQAPQLAVSVLLNLTSIPQDALTMLGTQLDQMLSLTLYSHQIDKDLALGYMLSMDQETAFSALNKRLVRENVYNDFARLQQLARLGSQVARIWQQIGFLHICTELEINSKWWHHLNLLGINCEHKAFRSDRRDYKVLQSIVPQLLEATNLDLYCVLDFSRQYNIPDSFPCLHFVKSLLLTSNDYDSQIVGVLDEVHKHELIPLLLSVLPKLDPFDYDRLLFVLNLLEKSEYSEKNEIQNRIQVLHFLKHFSTPLPFHALVEDPWNVLEPHLSLATSGQLISLCSPLDIDADEMYMRLIKRMIDGDTTTLTFDSFRGILCNFSEIDHKITTAEWLSKKITNSDFSIAAVQFALDLSTAQNQHPKTARLQQTLLLLQTAQHWNNLSKQFDGAALPSFNDPKKLIEIIYQDYGHLAWQAQSNIVHETAAQIAHLHKVEVSSARREIRWKWLTSGHKKQNQSVWSMPDYFDDEHLFESLLYISWITEQDVVRELMKYACDPLPRPSLTYRVKYRCLLVIERLADVMQFQISTFIPDSLSASFAQIKQACRHLVSFEELQYPHSLSTFIKCDKESLVRGLWREHFQDTAVLALISELMVSYSISNPSLWQRVLQQMTNLSMFPTIFHILQPLIREFPSVDLHSVFEQTLMWPLHNIDPSLPSSKIGRVLEEIVLLIQQCPFIESLNVTEVVHLLHEAAQKNHNLPILADCAVRCAFGIPRVSIRQKTLCQLCDDNETYVIPIFQYLVDLSPLQQPLEAVFLVDYLITNPGAQEILVQSPLGRKYCEWIAILPQTEALDLVVAFLLDNHRFDDASDVAAHHLQHFPEKQLDASTPLQCYLLQTSSPLLLPYREKLAESTLTLE
ncbi:hypothetical protein LEN26_010367 [Aphanomyces euteiches]|nr:hypothetical protein AeMF1_018841 [Aphanomyces euteiches]KAH9122111.1 hypothetical protein LEN26_010367 [Aphanomyces euteiches]KAH9196542.1 hypothetical protein AeNC1_001479 [Aphanomyces euteiches]